MEKCQYEPINIVKDITNENKNVKFQWKYFLRQLLVSSCLWTSYFTMGLVFGAPTVIIPQIRREANSTDAVSEEMTSWLSSVYGYASVPWIIAIPLLSRWLGRKYPLIFVNITSLIGFIFFYFSTSILHILITQVIHSILVAAQLTISIIIITEYSSPRYRGIFLTLKSASFNWGMWVANSLGTFYHWKSIAFAGIFCTSYCIVTTFFWHESPYWLATKCRFEASSKAHRWAKGVGEESEKELDAMIQCHKEFKEQNISNKRVTSNFLIRWYKIATQKAFYKPVILCMPVMSLYQCSGKLVCSVYAIDIIKKITLNESTAYQGMLLLDGVTVFGMYVGCGLSKVLNRKTLLLGGSTLGIIFLFILSLYLYLIKLSIVEENKYASLVLLTLFSMSISCGPIILSSSIYGELLPLRYKESGALVVSVYNIILLSTYLKLGPLIFRTFQMHGAFLFYAVISSIVSFLIYKFLPETKDKTLEEIENILLGKTEKRLLEK